MRVRLEVEPRLSPERFCPCPSGPLVRGQTSNGLRLPPRIGLFLPLTGVVSASFAVNRVVRAVVGGDAGANLGAAGVLGVSPLSSMGVLGLFSASTASSMSVGASSSSVVIVTSFFLDGKSRRRGLTWVLACGRSRCDSRPASSSSSPWWCASLVDANLRNCFLPRLGAC